MGEKTSKGKNLNNFALDLYQVCGECSKRSVQKVIKNYFLCRNVPKRRMET